MTNDVAPWIERCSLGMFQVGLAPNAQSAPNGPDGGTMKLHQSTSR